MNNSDTTSHLLDKMFTEKIKTQKIINNSLELLLNFAEQATVHTEEAIDLVRQMIEDYEKEECVVPKRYKDRYVSLKTTFYRHNETSERR